MRVRFSLRPPKFFYMKISYRPEIDGLRAIAVVSVILYHLNISFLNHQPFKGGFIGVDIFFVISGYLISSIIFKELFNTGTFSFRYFYERRIRRILPALLLLMLITLPVAWIYLLPNSFIDFSKSVLFSLSFSSNFYFHYSGQEYGASSGMFKPYLHTWALSVEEQFYILFPIILFMAFKYFKKYIFFILIIIFLMSLVLAEWGSKNYPSLNFYMLPTRGWELLAGSILAYFEIKNGHRSKNQLLILILPSIGFILIIINIIFFKLHFPHPSFYTLLSIIGVCLIIWFSQKGELVNRILSSRLFVGIGLISYSLYLWHYPVFAFDSIIDFSQDNIFKKLLLGFLILLFSIFSYYFVERPARDKKYKYKLIFFIIIFSYLILILFNSNVILKKGHENRMPDLILKNLSDKPWEILKDDNGTICFHKKNGCKFNTSSSKKVYVIGDSHMGSLMYDLKNRLINRGYQFITLTLTGCLYYPGFNLIQVKTKKVSKICNEDYFKKLEKILLKEKNSIIIFSGRFPLHLNNTFFNNEEGAIEDENAGQKVGEWHLKYISTGNFKTIQDSFKISILKIAKNNKIILIYPIPEAGWHIPKKVLNLMPKFIFNKDYLKPENYITTSLKVYEKRSKTSFELLNSIKSNNVYRVYPHKLFCDTIIKKRCLTHDDKRIFYFDDDHPSTEGQKIINNEIIDKINEIELKNSERYEN